MSNPKTQDISAQAYWARLAERGVDYVFANAGTDFAPLIESLALNADGRRKYPKVITVPHENVAMAMAHGYYRVAGKPAAVMVHVTVGTGNTVNGIMNAARDNIPILLAAGRTPVTETGHKASRNRPIHWGQESFDQGGMVREFTKWDYELRSGQPVAAVVDRALDIAMSEPRGPVYLTLPREVLTDEATSQRRSSGNGLGAMAAVPSQDAIEKVADLIAGAQFPLILTSALGRSPEAFEALAALAEEYALPVVQSEPNDLNLSTAHPINLGFDIKSMLPRADVVVVLDAPVPWIPKSVSPARDAKVIHHLAGSATDAVSVPRFRGRSAGDRHHARRAADAARSAARQTQARRYRKAARKRGQDARRNARRPPPRDGSRQGRACRSRPRTSRPASTSSSARMPSSSTSLACR